MSHYHPYSWLTVLVAIAIASLLPKVFWKSRSLDNAWNIFQKWCDKSGFKLAERDPSFENPDGPVATSVIHGMQVSITVYKNRQKDFVCTIQVITQHCDDLRFNLSEMTIIDELGDSIGLTRFTTGNNTFDKVFDVGTNDTDRLLRAFDQITIENFVNNSHLFEDSPLEMRNNCMTYTQYLKRFNNESLESLEEIARFMAEISSRIDKT